MHLQQQKFPHNIFAPFRFKIPVVDCILFMENLPTVDVPTVGLVYFHVTSIIPSLFSFQSAIDYRALPFLLIFLGFSSSNEKTVKNSRMIGFGRLLSKEMEFHE